MAEQTEKKKLTVPDLIAERLLRPAFCVRGGERVDTDSPLVPPPIEIAA